ncbi:MAG: pilus assembly protein PilP [Gammaproteobacteria bacterium]|nr:pilus assembly protein PilP [Gammaproteobacteria bacterium]
MTISNAGMRAWSAAATLILLLTGCVSKGMGDLEDYTKEVLARKGGRIEPPPEIKPYEPYAYKSADASARDPFEPFYQVRKTETSEVADTGLSKELEQEIKNRNREELERFELDSLKMVGTIQNDDENWAVIADPAGVVHRVKVGNYMGRNIGKVVNIFEDKIELREIVQNSQGKWEERQAAVALVE